MLEHSKIIGERNFTKNKVNHVISNFGVFMAYRIVEKIVIDIEI